MTINQYSMIYGVKVTDACIDWETTEKCITATADKLRDVLKARV